MAINDAGSNVRRFMKMRKMTIPQLSESSNLGSATISNLLNGKNSPNSTTLIKISNALDVPINMLLEDAPKMSSFRFRANKALSAREKASSDQVIFDTARWLKNFNELEEITGNAIKFGLSSSKGIPPIEAAEKARKGMGLDPNEPVCDIINSIENAGIKIKITSFGFKQTFGISIGPKDGGPAIVVNSFPGITVERQIFTAAHELGHLLLHLSSFNGIEISENPSEEKDADLFAAHFLMPEQLFKDKWNEFYGGTWVDTILRVKQFFGVSYESVIHRFAELKPLRPYQDYLMMFNIEFNKEYNHDLKEHYEPNALESKAISKTTRYSYLVRMAYEKGEISISKAAELLDLSAIEMKELIGTWKI